MNEDAELKPCPFCGEGAEVYCAHKSKLGEAWGIVHSGNWGCPVRFERSFDTEAEAIAAWNTRAQSDAAALVEALAKRRPFVMEQVDAGVWSLVLRFGKGIDSNQAMRETADVVRAALSACEQARGA